MKVDIYISKSVHVLSSFLFGKELINAQKYADKYSYSKSKFKFSGSFISHKNHS